MTSTRYTNAVLTVIALVLSVMAIQNVVRPSTAQPTLQTVVLCDVTGVACLDVARDYRGSFINVVPLSR